MLAHDSKLTDRKIADADAAAVAMVSACRAVAERHEPHGPFD